MDWEVQCLASYPTPNPNLALIGRWQWVVYDVTEAVEASQP